MVELNHIPLAALQDATVDDIDEAFLLLQVLQELQVTDRTLLEAAPAL